MTLEMYRTFIDLTKIVKTHYTADILFSHFLCAKHSHFIKHFNETFNCSGTMYRLNVFSNLGHLMPCWDFFTELFVSKSRTIIIELSGHSFDGDGSQNCYAPFLFDVCVYVPLYIVRWLNFSWHENFCAKWIYSQAFRRKMSILYVAVFLCLCVRLCVHVCLASPFQIYSN